MTDPRRVSSTDPPGSSHAHVSTIRSPTRPASDDPRVRLRVAAFLLVALAVWTVSLLRAAAYSIYVDLDARMIDEMRIADERVMVASLIGLAIAGATAAWIQVRRPDDRTRLHLALALGSVTTGVIGAMEASEALGPWTGLRPGWSGIWLLLFPLVLGAGTAPTSIAVLAGALLHLGARLLTLSGPTDYTAELVSFGVMGLVGLLALLPREATQLLADQREREHLGSYVLGRPLGAGGMGRVHLAVHRYLGREVAIKRVAMELTAVASLGAHSARLQREAQLLAHLSSPHTVTLHDFGITRTGDVYYVMEHLDGVDLGELVERFGAQPPARVAQFLLQAADSLLEAHQRGIVHRDVKPSNLFLSIGPRVLDHLTVLDFGLATGAGLDDAPAGTPGYLAPEVEQGEPATTASDVFALGRVATLLLSGNIAVLDTPPDVELLEHLTQSRSFAELVQAMLAREPSARPSLDALTPLLESEARPWNDEAARRWWHAHLPDHLARAENPRLQVEAGVPSTGSSPGGTS